MSWCQGPGAGSEGLHLPVTASWDLRGAGAEPSPSFAWHFSSNKAKRSLLVNLTPFYYPTHDFREADVCLFEREAQFEITAA